MQVGQRLRQVRESKNLSQGHIEKQTGLLRAYCSRVENGHTVPSIDTLEKWTRALGITMGQLFADDGKEPKAPVDFEVPKIPKLNRAGANGLRRLSQAFTRMSPKDRTLLVGFANKLAARSGR